MPGGYELGNVLTQLVRGGVDARHYRSEWDFFLILETSTVGANIKLTFRFRKTIVLRNRHRCFVLRLMERYETHVIATHLNDTETIRNDDALVFNDSVASTLDCFPINEQ